jgi:hypothetical protein
VGRGEAPEADARGPHMGTDGGGRTMANWRRDLSARRMSNLAGVDRRLIDHSIRPTTSISLGGHDETWSLHRLS